MSFSRQEQLDLVLRTLELHAEAGNLIREAKRLRSEQVSQLTGLYEEVDKLTKGKSIVPPSDLLVDLVNGLISDTKRVVYRDTYLDRLKIFVPAGNNPGYPDVLVALRVVQQSLGRFSTMLQSESDRHSSIGLDLTTISAALFIAQREEEGEAEEDSEESEETELEPDVEDDNDSEAEEEEAETDYGADDSDSQGYEEYVTNPRVARELHEVALADEWFRWYQGDSIFNFERLDRLGVPKYEPPPVGITFVKTEQ